MTQPPPRRPFSSAHRVAAKPQPPRPKPPPDHPTQTWQRAKSLAPEPDGSPVLRLEVWESADRLRRCLVERLPDANRRKWTCLRIARPDTVVGWDPLAQAVGSTSHWELSDLKRRIRTWLIYRR